MRTTFRSIVNVTQHPKLRDKVINKEMFRCSCSKCGQRGMLLKRCLYIDEQKGFMVYLVPDFEERRLFDRRVEQAYPELTHMKRRVVTNVNNLREKILLLEEGIDDQAIEMSKLVLSGVVSRRRSIRMDEIYCNELNEEENRIGFTIFGGKDSEPVTCRTRAEMYQLAKEIVTDYRVNNPEKGFERIDMRWASRVLAEYRNMMEAEEAKQQMVSPETEEE